MNRRIKTFGLLVALTVVVTLFGVRAIQAQKAVPQPIDYRNLLGKSRNDQAIVNLIAIDGCVEELPYLLCREAGMALWLDSNQSVRKIHLYVNNSDGFALYQGELPLGLKFYDIMGAVEYKLNRLGVGSEGRPEETAVPDHMHYWAFYNEQGVTIIYNSPFADEDATIYAVLVTK